MAAARCEAPCGALGRTCRGWNRGSMPLTASKTEADTIAAMREVKNGGVPSASTVSFMMLIHSNTGSGGAAADGLGVAAMPMSSRAQTEVIRRNRKVEVTITGEEHARLSSARAVEPEAYEAYLKGRYYWNKRTADSMPKAALFFEQAISKDPGYGAAYSGLADCNSGLAWHGFMSPAEVLPKAYAAAQG